MPELLRDSFTCYGITPEHWEIIRHAPLIERDGAKFIRPVDVLEASRAQAKGAAETLRTAAEYIDSEESLRTNRPAALRASMEAGTAKAKYLAELIVDLTVVVAVSVQAHNLVKGKDPQDMKDPKFWGQALIQGGGAGIFGDYIFSDVNHYWAGMVQTFAGPVAPLVDDSAKLTLGNLHEYLQGKEAHFSRDLVNFAQHYTPGNNTWYARLAMERLMWDSLRRMADPQAETSFRRIMQNARRDYNQEFWWKPGELLPERAPDFSGTT